MNAAAATARIDKRQRPTEQSNARPTQIPFSIECEYFCVLKTTARTGGTFSAVHMKLIPVHICSNGFIFFTFVLIHKQHTMLRINETPIFVCSFPLSLSRCYISDFFVCKMQGDFGRSLSRFVSFDRTLPSCFLFSWHSPVSLDLSPYLSFTCARSSFLCFARLRPK